MDKHKSQLVERENNVLTMQKCFVCSRSIPEHTEPCFRGYKHFRKWLADSMDDIKHHLWVKGARKEKVTFKQYILENAMLSSQHRKACINCRQSFYRANLAWIDEAVQKVHGHPL